MDLNHMLYLIMLKHTYLEAKEKTYKKKLEHRLRGLCDLEEAESESYLFYIF